jgi:hypothetical protein
MTHFVFKTEGQLSENCPLPNLAKSASENLMDFINSFFPADM